MKKLMIIPLLFLIYIPISMAEQTPVLDCLSFKLTVNMNGEEIEYEYINPSEFEVEKGSNVTKGKQAIEEVQNIYQLVNLSDKTEVSNIVKNLRASGYSTIEKLDVRWINTDGELYTWIWEE